MIWIVLAIITLILLIVPLVGRAELYFDLRQQKMIAVVKIYGIKVIKVKLNFEPEGITASLNGNPKKSLKKTKKMAQNSEKRGKKGAKNARKRAKYAQNNDKIKSKNKTEQETENTQKEPKKYRINPIPMLKRLNYKRADVALVFGSGEAASTAVTCASLRFAVDSILATEKIKSGSAAVYEDWQNETCVAALSLKISMPIVSWIYAAFALEIAPIKEKKKSENEAETTKAQEAKND